MQRPFEIPTEVYPFESKWLEVDGQTIHYVDEGEGPVIVFCHGNPSWSLLYVDIIKELRSDFRCIAMDYPGFGMSGKPDIAQYGYTPGEHSAILQAFIEKMGLTDFSIFVQDWGGPIGLGAAGRMPERIRRMYIGNTWAWKYKEGTEMYTNAKAFSDKMGGPESKARIMEKNTFLKISMNQLLAGAKKNTPDLADAVKAAWLAPFSTPESRLPTWVFPGQIMGAGDFLTEVENNMAKLADKPAVLFWGMKDMVFPPSTLEDWRKMLNNIQKEVPLPEANHFFQTEEPELIAKTIREFE